jgi:hypothetical protein
MVTIHPASPEDFCDYDQLMTDLYRTLTGRVNHIFSCLDDDLQMMLRQSNLVEHREFVFNLCKKGTWDGMLRTEIANTLNSVLVLIHYAVLNPYKVVEMFQKYRPVVPEEFHLDDLYAEPSTEVSSKVKTEKIDQVLIKKTKSDKVCG